MIGIFSSFKPENILPFLPPIIVITYILAVLSLLGTLIPSLDKKTKISLSFLVCALTLCFTLSLNETFYWISGTPYFFACTLMILAFNFAAKAFNGSITSFILCMIVLFLNGTNLEQPCIYQGIAAFLAMLLFFQRKDTKKALMSGAFWLVSIAVFCVMYFAPGTAWRMSAINIVPVSWTMKLLRGFVVAFSTGFVNTLQFFAKPVIYSVIFFLPLIAEKIAPFDEKLSQKLKGWHIVAAMFAISIFMQYMGGVISGSALPVRAISLTFWLMYFTWAIFWVFMYRGKMLHSEGFRNVCSKLRWPVLILSVIVSANFTECVSAFRTAPDFAKEWQSRVDMIASQAKNGVKTVIIHPLKTKTELIFSDLDPNITWNRPSFSHYYGAEDIILVPEELSNNSDDVRRLMSGDLEPYAKLAERGDTEAMKVMGDYRDPRTHEEKIIGTKDPSEALRWYIMGAEAGDPKCMGGIAKLMVRQNFLKALYWKLKYHVLTTRL